MFDNFLLQFKSKNISIRSVISRILAVVVSIVLILVSIEINRGITFIDVFSSTYYEINAISVIVLNNSDYEKLNELEGKSLGINQN